MTVALPILDRDEYSGNDKYDTYLDMVITVIESIIWWLFDFDFLLDYL